MVKAHNSHEGNGNDMQGWANTDSNDSLFHAFTGEDGAGLRAVCNGRIRPAERHRRRDCGLLTAEAARALPFTTHLCERCTVKADTPAKSTADVIADGAPLYKRAGLRHAAVGRGRRVHYSRGNDDTLCGRALTAYLDLDEAAARYARGDELCTRCMLAAEELAYAKALAAASPVRPAIAGSAPTDAEHPDTLAALDVLTGTQLATITDEHDFTGSDDYDKTAHGALVEPRGYGRVAVYWLVEGLYVTPDDREPHRAELRLLAAKFRAAGWEIEPSSVRSVFAWRPSASA
ncbi:hypothetical protein [Streptomyces sp. MBT53]|uniref:hypothetical protein n=1 Tax=Streptomyces sp. MBT53 TaxID=1488384 RepID=UPI0019136D1C|nr:hypothetical protein [Streptomyces sp. MBT53]MBK6017725.1 hypothetical protein [Streptomyces sp. MBT53]